MFTSEQFCSLTAEGGEYGAMQNRHPQGRRGAMDNFIERLNIAHYLEQLKTVTDPIKRETLQQLLVEEKAKQVSQANVEK
jgi:hypothetical protein